MGRRTSIQSYQDLEVWQRGVDLVERVYECKDSFPEEEKYGLSSQVRRATVSISANIAEGWGYSSRKQYVHFLEQARSSLLEVETHLIIAERLGYIARSALDDILQETTVESKMLLSLMRSLQR